MKIKLLLLIVFFHTVLCSFVTHSQTLTPVDAGLSGEWLLDNAEVRERPTDSRESYTIRSVSQDEFRKNSYLLNIPTQIIFMSYFMAQISHISWSRPVVAVMNNGLLEFRDYQESPEDYSLPELLELDSYPAITPAFQLTQEENQLNLQCPYSYFDSEGNPVEGILSINYKPF